MQRVQRNRSRRFRPWFPDAPFAQARDGHGFDHKRQHHGAAAPAASTPREGAAKTVKWATLQRLNGYLWVRLREERVKCGRLGSASRVPAGRGGVAEQLAAAQLREVVSHVVDGGSWAFTHSKSAHLGAQQPLDQKKLTPPQCRHRKIRRSMAARASTRGLICVPSRRRRVLPRLLCRRGRGAA